MENKKYFPMFDYLRFACCILIFLYHYDGICSFSLGIDRIRTLDFIIRNGNEAIVLFFMLSGFCMAYRYRDRIRERKIAFSAYAWKHYSRFLAMTLVTLPLTIIKSILMYKAGLDTMPNLYGYVLDILGIRTGYSIHAYFGYNGPLWFINVLFIMYVLYYLIVYISKSRTVYMVICIVLALFAVSQQAVGSVAVFILNANTYTGMGGFFIGAVLFEIYEYYLQYPHTMRRIRILCLILVLGVAAVLYVNLHFPGIGVLPDDSNLWTNYSLVLTLAFWPSLILLLSKFRSGEKSSVNEILSRLSTSVYIWHWPVIYILYTLVLTGAVHFEIGSRTCTILAVGITGSLSFISAFGLEKRMQTGINRFFRRA